MKGDRMADARPILLIDGNNVFMQMWHAFHATTNAGKSAGGIVGFLTAISRYSEEMMPKRVYVTWEHGGSAFRQNIFPEYKQNRKKHPEDVMRDRTEQLLCLIKILKHTPVCQLYVSRCEGDDIIAHACHRFHDSEKIIISTDKDYYQLIDERTKIFAPIQKVYVNEGRVRERYNMVPQNFAIFKALCGDGSDNIPGVRGIGEKTMLKLFPVMSERKLTLSEIYDICAENSEKHRLYRKIIQEFDIIKKYWSIIQLGSSILTDEQIDRVNNIIDQHEQKINHQELMKTMIQEGLSFNHERLFESMINLCA